jgi:integrase
VKRGHLLRHLRRHGCHLKREGSERDISMNATARDSLLEQRPRTAMKGDLVFVNRNQTHDYQCRHICATLALDAGASPREVADLLGHTSVEMVYRRYARWIEGQNQGAVGALDRALGAA